jgi:hypothetical protein
MLCCGIERGERCIAAAQVEQVERLVPGKGVHRAFALPFFGEHRVAAGRAPPIPAGVTATAAMNHATRMHADWQRC